MKEAERFEMERRLNEAGPLKDKIEGLKAVLAAKDVEFFVTCRGVDGHGNRGTVCFDRLGVPQGVLRDHLAGMLAKMEAEYAAI